jgi:hypothetical protein
MRSRPLAISLAVAFAAIVAARAASGATNFDVTNNGFAAFTINGVDNPTLTLTRGETYTFSVNAPDHPFWLTTARGAGNAAANAFSPGVAGNGVDSSTITFVVPASAPATLFYQCGIHDVMGGTLDIVSAPVVTSMGPAMSGALALVLMLVGLRRRPLARA